MTLTNRKQAAEVLTKILRAHSPSWTPRDILRNRLRVFCSHAQQIGLQPEDVLTPDGRDAFCALVTTIAWRDTPTLDYALRLSLCAEWQTVVQLAA